MTGKIRIGNAEGVKIEGNVTLGGIEVNIDYKSLLVEAREHMAEMVAHAIADDQTHDEWAAFLESVDQAIGGQK